MRIWKRSIIVAAIVGALCAPTFAMASQANSFGDMNFTGAQLTEFKLVLIIRVLLRRRKRNRNRLKKLRSQNRNRISPAGLCRLRPRRVIIAKEA